MGLWVVFFFCNIRNICVCIRDGYLTWLFNQALSSGVRGGDAKLNFHTFPEYIGIHRQSKVMDIWPWSYTLFVKEKFMVDGEGPCVYKWNHALQFSFQCVFMGSTLIFHFKKSQLSAIYFHAVISCFFRVSKHNPQY